MYHIFCIHSSVEGHLGSFQLLAIINKAAMNIVEHVSLLPLGTSSGYMPSRGISGSTGSTMSSFRMNRQTDFQSCCTTLQSHQQWRSVPLSPHPHQHLLLPEFLILAILTSNQIIFFSSVGEWVTVVRLLFWSSSFTMQWPHLHELRCCGLREGSED